jgi:hypothetical protein
MIMSSTTSIAPLQSTQQTTTTDTASTTATANGSTTTTTKKKFGKNLTKIVQSQQQVTQTDTRSSNTNVTNRNGLLLLSTKKGINNPGTSTSNVTSSPAVSNFVGVGTSAIASITSTLGTSISGGVSASGGGGLGLVSSFDSSVAGLGISSRGASGGLLSSSSNVFKDVQPLDAWGVAAAAAAEKAAAATTAATSQLLSVSASNASAGKKGSADLPVESSTEEGRISPCNVTKRNDEFLSSHYNQTTNIGSEENGSKVTSDGQKSSTTPTSAVPSAAWDEYGGRGGSHSISQEATTTASSKTKKVVQNLSVLADPDKEYMTSKARERALELQRAEEQRLKEQRDRITARLKELSVQTSVASTITSINANNNISNNSSAKGGETQQLTPAPAATGTTTSTVSMIHLTSYEDRDRGMPAQNAQPRMLFDPKSGSMIAVKSRDEQQMTNTTSNKSGNKKSSTSKKTQLQQINGKLSGGSRSNNNGLASPTGKESSLANSTIRGRKNSESSDAMPTTLQLLKNLNPPAVDTIKALKKSSPHAQAHPSSPSPLSAVPPIITRARRLLPRTCGVLYKRHTNQTSTSSSIKANTFRGSADDAHSLFCADSCEGDLGYGAHSVPGGRTRNPDGYAKCKQQQQQSTPLLSSRFTRSSGVSTVGAGIGKQPPYTASSKGSNSSRSKAWDNQQHDIMQSSYLRHRYDSTTIDTRGGKANNSSTDATALSMLYTGYHPSQTRDDDEKSNLAMYQLVTADDKLELIGMDDDEPTLKVTSNPFAPSRAALEAAATLRTKDSYDSDYDDDNDDIDDEMDNIHNNNILLGVVGLHEDVDNGGTDDDDYDDEDIDEHHHLTVNKAALNILEDDDDDHHLRHGLMNQIDDDPLGLVGFGHIDSLLPKSTTATSRLVRLEDIPLDTSLLTPSFAGALAGDGNAVGSSVVTGENIGSASAYNATAGHNIFGFGSPGPWGATTSTMPSQTNANSDWDILKLTAEAGLGSKKSSSVGLFGSENAFGMPSLVSGMPSTTSWGSSTFEGLNLNGNALATTAKGGRGGKTNNAD